MLKVLNKFISSSISMALLGVTGWSVAYAYGWGQSYFYGFPWWYVDIGTSNVARSLGYVIWATSILLVIYLIGLFCLSKAKKIMSDAHFELLRAYILIAILLSPLLLGCIALIGDCNYYVIGIYIVLIFFFTLIFKSKIKQYIPNISIRTVLRFLYKNQNYIILGSYTYLVLFAFVMGYVRPNFKTAFDTIDINNKSYYVLAKYSDTFVLANNIDKNQEHFYIYKLSPNSLYHINVLEVSAKIQK